MVPRFLMIAVYIKMLVGMGRIPHMTIESTTTAEGLIPRCKCKTQG